MDLLPEDENEMLLHGVIIAGEAPESEEEFENDIKWDFGVENPENRLPSLVSQDGQKICKEDVLQFKLRECTLNLQKHLHSVVCSPLEEISSNITGIGHAIAKRNAQICISRQSINGSKQNMKKTMEELLSLQNILH